VTLAVTRPDGRVHRVGYEPDPWAWTPWEYGPFTGRWDDPEDLYRVLYAGSSPLGCFLEVLAVFRADTALVAELDAIEGDADDDEFPTVPAGRVDRAWLIPRRLGSAILSGDYVDVGHSQTIAELRPRFLARAVHYGLVDVDAGALRLSAPRAFTQEVSRFLYTDLPPSGEAPAGIAFESRHGDDQQLWAIYERDTDVGAPRSRRIDQDDAVPIVDDHPDLVAAMTLHHLEWD
jgi:hypothetical protein